MHYYAAFWNAIIVAADGFYKAVPLGRYTQRDADLATQLPEF